MDLDANRALNLIWSEVSGEFRARGPNRDASGGVNQTGSVRPVALFASVVMAVALFVVSFFWGFQRRLIYLPSSDAVRQAAA